jgi:spore maturation protein CgeB
MRVMVVHPGADCSVSDVHDGIVTGLRQNGVTAESLNSNDRLYVFIHAHIPDRHGDLVPAFSELEAVHLTSREVLADWAIWRPDVIVFVSGFFIAPDILQALRRLPVHLVLWATEAPYEDDKQLAVAPLFHTVILNDPLTIDAYRKVQPRTWYLPHSYDPKRHRPGRPRREFVSDFGWVGTGFPSRVEFLEQVDFDGIDVCLGGNWQFIEDSPVNRWVRNPHGRKWMLNNETIAVYRSAKAGANFYRKENTSGVENGWAMGPREVEMAATGCFFLRDPRGEGDELFPMLPTFDGPADFGDKLRWWLAHDDERAAAAQAARAAIADRTFKQTTAQFLRLLSESDQAVAA